MTDTRDRDRTAPDLNRLYQSDLVAWTRNQAGALRRAASDGQPAGADHRLDWDNLAEEIESLGRSQRDALASQIRRILHHLAKLEFSPAVAPRNDWRRSVREARVAAQQILDANPSLRVELASFVADQTRPALWLAKGDLEDYGECDDARRLALVSRRYDEADVLSDAMPERPQV